MALLEAFSTDDLFNLIIYDTIVATPCCSQQGSSLDPASTTPTPTSFLLENGLMKNPHHQDQGSAASGNYWSGSSAMTRRHHHCSTKGTEAAAVNWRQDLAVQGGHKKRRRRPRSCKNKEEADRQRTTHIAIERSRRRLMNEHLAVLRSLMPDSYVQRGDQASIVGGAIEFLKELEHLVQFLEAQKLKLLPPQERLIGGLNEDSNSKLLLPPPPPPPFSQFLGYPKFTWSPHHLPNKYSSKTKKVTAEIEVTLIESHANIQILSRKSPQKLLKITVEFHTLRLTILHLNVTTLDQLVLYSISAKVEEGCQLTSADDIAGAVQHMLRIIEEEGTPY